MEEQQIPQSTGKKRRIRTAPTDLGHPADIHPRSHPPDPDEKAQPALLVLVRQCVRILPSIVPSARESSLGGEPDEPRVEG